MKRLFDVVVAAVALVIGSPLVAAVCVAIWLQDRNSPFYIGTRVGLNGRDFDMFKLRSMVVDADRTGVDSTGSGDPRITAVGRTVRRFKLDELPQLWNVLRGDMSLVGPRPNVRREVDLYTSEEWRLLSVRPGITDLASVVFADESEILAQSVDPDLDYNRLIRPWKSRLGLMYVENRSLRLDIAILLVTARNVVDRDGALEKVEHLVRRLGADDALCRVAGRRDPLQPHPPPGAAEPVRSRATRLAVHAGDTA